MYSNTFSFFTLLFLLDFSLFKLAGWPKRAIIARGSQWVPKDIAAISLSLAVRGAAAAAVTKFLPIVIQYH